MNFEPTSYFFEIVRCKSITRAAQELKISQPALSRYLKMTETKIGTKLYTYASKEIILTQAGLAFADFLQDRKNLEDTFLEHLHQKTKQPEGQIILLTTPGVANEWIMPFIAAYLEAYPLVSINIMKTNEDITLKQGCDITISSKIVQPNVESLFLNRSEIKLFAGKGYLKKFSIPKSLDDLKKHRIISLSKHIIHENPIHFMFSEFDTKYGIDIKPFLVVPSVIALKHAALNNIGIVALDAKCLSRKEKDLIEILSDHTSLKIDIYMSYYRKSKNNEPLKSFRLFLQEKIRATLK